MTTRKALNDICRLRLGDLSEPYEFSDQQINRWITDAIAEYSLSFPRRLCRHITTTAGQRDYPLEDIPEFQRVLRVEYPYGQEPSCYLTHRRQDDRRGFLAQPVYDLELTAPQTLTLVIGVTPAAGETIALTYQADHSFPQNDEDELSVPDRHLELLVLFVRQAAMQEQLARHSAAADAGSLLLSSLSENAARAAREYREQLEAARLAQDAGSWVSWGGADGV